MYSELVSLFSIIELRNDTKLADVVEAVLKQVGSDITNAILRTPDGSNHKSIDVFTLYEVMKVAIDGADQPNMNDVLEQLIEVINHPFDFRKKVSINMELMQSNAAQMATYGIVIGIPQLMLTLLANIKTTTKSNYGRCSVVHAICKKYAYNHVHDVTLLQTILTELAGADGVRTLRDALHQTQEQRIQLPIWYHSSTL